VAFERLPGDLEALGDSFTRLGRDITGHRDPVY